MEFSKSKLWKVALFALVVIGAATFYFSRLSVRPASIDSTASSASSATNAGNLPAERDPAARKTKSSDATSTKETFDTIAAATANENVRQKLTILSEILRSRNDNDPRLDGQLRTLDRETKAAFRAAYRQMLVEDRNGRGTIVFLLGRNLSDDSDVDFLREILREEPCLSFENCASPPKLGPQDEPPSEMALNYPQAVVLASLEKVLNDPTKSPALKNQAQNLLVEASHYKAPVIARLGQRLATRSRK